MRSRQPRCTDLIRMFRRQTGKIKKTEIRKTKDMVRTMSFSHVHGIDVEERAVSGGRAESIQERSLHNVEEFKVIDNYLMIRLPDEIDHHKSVDISTKADRYIMNKKVGNVVFDFERTTFMDSSGIGIILGRYKKIACFGGKVYAINADNRIRRILLLSGLQNIVEIISN